MSFEATARLDLPLLAPGQAQKELFHNEALAMIDIAVQASVRSAGATVPPEDPSEGDCWIVGDAPVGEWAGYAGCIAGWTAGGWRFVVPCNGMAAWDQSGSLVLRHSGGRWLVEDVHARSLVIGDHQVVGMQQPPIATPAGGAVVDTEARTTLASVLAVLRTHGLLGT